MKKKIAWPLMMGVLLLAVQLKAQEPIVFLSFQHFVGKEVLQLTDKVYHNGSGEPFSVNKFKYYISNIVVMDSAGRRVQPYPGIYLIDENNPLSKGFFIGPAPSFHMHSIQFTVGVDSSMNVGSVKTGALDPLNGMFWTWNTGYVYAKLEGQSNSSNAAFHQFTYDVGGYKKGQDATRRVHLKLDPNQSGLNIAVKVDVLKWFDAATKVSISQTPLCHEPGKLAMQLANNYAQMFSIPQVHN